MDNEVSEVWDEYAKKYNSLSNKMEEAGIDIKLLRDLVDAVQNLNKVMPPISISE